MPQDFREETKSERYWRNKRYKVVGESKCLNCDTLMKIYIKRDLLRKKFCSKSCAIKYNLKTGKIIIPVITEETKEKMRQSKLNLLKTGWKPIGWLKYLPKIRISNRGYKFIGTKREHTILIENKLGRKLLPYEVVHHKDFNKLNNSLDNLVVMIRSDHIKLHLNQRILLSHKILINV